MVSLLCAVGLLAGCVSGGAGSPGSTAGSLVLADTTFMADIAQNVAGDRMSIAALLPRGADPHSFEPTPRDVTRLARSTAFIINNRGFEPLVDELLSGAGGPSLTVVEAAAGLTGLKEDPHFWLDPLGVVTYADNISRGLAALDPGGAQDYARNADAYARQLRELDAWIASEVATIPAARRQLVTNHESLGRFAARYGFSIVGTILHNASGEGSPSALELATLIEQIRSSGAPAVFLETGNNADRAAQVAQETGAKVVDDLYIHSLGPHAGTYLDMMRWDVERIVEALK